MASTYDTRPRRTCRNRIAPRPTVWQSVPARGRADALRFYTIGSAWFSHDETKRGSLEVGKFADLVVLSKDYLMVPIDQVGGIESLLTMVGGKIVFAAAPYEKYEKQK